MRVLWVSTRLFDLNEEIQSGVWLKALIVRLSAFDQVILSNVSVKKGIKEPVRCDFGKIIQWALPEPKLNRKGYPDLSVQKMYESIVCEFNPDIIQIWGSENPLGLLPFKNSTNCIKILTMQGVLASIGQTLLLGLSFKELLYTIGLREIITAKSLLSERRMFYKFAQFEEEMIKRSRYVITQSEWTESQILNINPNAVFYRTQRVLRRQFAGCKKWVYFDHSKPILFSSAIGYSLKGLHILIKALGIVKQHFPGIELRLAGITGRQDFLANGYFRYILKLIKENDLKQNIVWIGAIPADGIITNLQEASVFIHPSFVESYSLTFAEAMVVGTPCVISYAGAMPELAEDNKEALYFTPGDYKRCAYLIIRLLKDKELSFKLSINAVKRANERNVSIDIAQHQLDIYKDILVKESIKL